MALPVMRELSSSVEALHTDGADTRVPASWGPAGIDGVGKNELIFSFLSCYGVPVPVARLELLLYYFRIARLAGDVNQIRVKFCKDCREPVAIFSFSHCTNCITYRKIVLPVSVGYRRVSLGFSV